MTQKEPINLDEIRGQDRAHAWHPLFQHQLLEQRDLMVIERGQGCTVTDAEGRVFLDAAAGLWNVNVGYGRQEIAAAVTAQIEQLPYYPISQINVPATKLATRLAEVLPGDLNHVFFSNSGSEANETALKLVRQYGRQKYPNENRFKVIARYQGYHGFTYGAMSATGQGPRRTRFEPLVPGFLHVDPPYCFRCPLKLSHPSCGLACAQEIEEVVIKEGPETVIAVIAEPIIGGGGVLVPPDDYLPRLRQICDQYGLLLILDEVITGFGRTGALFASQHWDVQPDIMTIAKGATSGYLPLGACVVTPEIFEEFLGDPAEGREFSQVATYGGHPVCCAAGLANIDILMRERLWENSAEVGGYLLGQLQELDSPFVGEVRGKGLMVAMELVGEDGAMLDAARAAQVQGKIRDEGVLIGRMSHAMSGPESVLFLSPPLVLNRSEADQIAAAFDAGLRSIS